MSSDIGIDNSSLHVIAAYIGNRTLIYLLFDEFKGVYFLSYPRISGRIRRLVGASC